jgi:hypothetical protein
MDWRLHLHELGGQPILVVCQTLADEDEEDSHTDTEAQRLPFD